MGAQVLSAMHCRQAQLAAEDFKRSIHHTYSGVIFDHCQYHLKSFREGPTQLCFVFGPTCDVLDTIRLAEQLPDMDLGDLVYSKNMGAYCAASSTCFNGFPPARVVHMNQ